MCKASAACWFRRMGIQREGRLCAKPFPLACLSSDSFRTSGKNRPPEGRTSRQIPPGIPGGPPPRHRETKPHPAGGYYPPLRSSESVCVKSRNGQDRSLRCDESAVREHRGGPPPRHRKRNPPKSSRRGQAPALRGRAEFRTVFYLRRGRLFERPQQKFFTGRGSLWLTGSLKSRRSSP